MGDETILNWLHHDKKMYLWLANSSVITLSKNVELALTSCVASGVEIVHMYITEKSSVYVAEILLDALFSVKAFESLSLYSSSNPSSLRVLGGFHQQRREASWEKLSVMNRLKSLTCKHSGPLLPRLLFDDDDDDDVRSPLCCFPSSDKNKGLDFI